LLILPCHALHCSLNMTARGAELFSLVESRDVRALWLKALDDSFTSLLGVYALSIDLMLDRSCLCSVNFTVRDAGISPNVKQCGVSFSGY